MSGYVQEWLSRAGAAPAGAPAAPARVVSKDGFGHQRPLDASHTHFVFVDDSRKKQAGADPHQARLSPARRVTERLRTSPTDTLPVVHLTLLLCASSTVPSITFHAVGEPASHRLAHAH